MLTKTPLSFAILAVMKRRFEGLEKDDFWISDYGEGRVFIRFSYPAQITKHGCEAATQMIFSILVAEGFDLEIAYERIGMFRVKCFPKADQLCKST